MLLKKKTTGVTYGLKAKLGEVTLRRRFLPFCGLECVGELYRLHGAAAITRVPLQAHP